MIKNSNSTNDSLVAFFTLTFLLSLPFYILNALAYLNVVGKPKMGALYIALFTVTPIASASILTFRRRGSRDWKELLGRIFDFKRIAKSRWYAAIILMPDPFVFTAQFFTLVGTRVLVAWIFNNTGKSVFAAILFHAVDNTALVAFPEIMAITPWGSAVFCGLVIIAAFVVTLLWGPSPWLDTGSHLHVVR